MSKPYQKPIAHFIVLLNEEHVLAASQFDASCHESFNIENQLGSSLSTSEGFGESCLDSGGASNKGSRTNNYWDI